MTSQFLRLGKSLGMKVTLHGNMPLTIFLNPNYPTRANLAQLCPNTVVNLKLVNNQITSQANLLGLMTLLLFNLVLLPSQSIEILDHLMVGTFILYPRRINAGPSIDRYSPLSSMNSQYQNYYCSPRVTFNAGDSYSSFTWNRDVYIHSPSVRESLILRKFTRQIRQPNRYGEWVSHQITVLCIVYSGDIVT